MLGTQYTSRHVPWLMESDPVSGQPVAGPVLLSSTEPSKKCEVALETGALGLNGFRCPTLVRGKEYGLIIGGATSASVPELSSQATSTAGTILEATKVTS